MMDIAKAVNYRSGLRYMRSALCFLLSIMLAVSLVPLFSSRADAFESDGDTAVQSDAELEALLEAGDYAEGEVIIIVDDNEMEALSNSRNRGAFSTYSSDILESSEWLMGTSEEAYLESENLSEPRAQDGDESPQLFSAAADDTVSIRYITGTGMSTRDLLYALRDDPRVLSVEPNYWYHVGDTEDALVTAMDSLPVIETNDMTAYQWGNSNTDKTAMVKGKELGFGVNPPSWDTSRTVLGNTNAEGVVAVIDTGIDYTHPDLEEVMCVDLDALVGYGGPHGYNGLGNPSFEDPMDDSGHGTHCAGIIAGQWNEYGISGVASGVELVAAKAGTADGWLPSVAIIRCYQYLADVADAGIDLRVISNSWGGPVISRALVLAVTMLGNLGAVSIFASGNETTNVDTIPNKSSQLQLNPYAVVIDSSTSTAGLSSFSNYGRASTDVVSPGSMILSTYPTSMLSYFPEAVLPTSASYGNIVYESFGVNPYKVTFEKEETSPNAIGVAGSDYYFDADNHSSWEIDASEMRDLGTSSQGVRACLMKVAVPQNQLEEVKYLGMRVYAETVKDASVYLQLSMQAENKATGNLEKISVIEGDFIHWYGSDWGIVSADLAAACERNNARLVLGDGDELEFELIMIRVDGGFASGEKICVDTVGLGREGAAVAYQYANGTSMATPAASGAAAVLSTLDDAAADPAERAKMRAARLQGSVKEVEAFADLCTSGGAIDLTTALEDFTPVIQNAGVSSVDSTNIISIIGNFFGSTEGSVTVGGLSAAVKNWSDTKVEVVCPEGLSSSVMEITLSADNGKTGKKTLLIDLPSPPAEQATPLFERNYSLPTNDESLEAKIDSGQLVGLGGFIYLVPGNELTEDEESASLWRLDPESGEWSRCPDFPQSLRMATMATYDGKVFVSGAREGDSGGLTPLLFSWDPITSSWTTHDASSILPGSTITNFNGTLLFIGSESIDEDTGSPIGGTEIMSYDIGTGKTHQVGTLSAGSFAPLSTAVWGTELYVCNSKHQEGGFVFDRLVWEGDTLSATDVSASMPEFSSEQENWIAIAAAAQGVVLTGSSGIQEQEVDPGFAPLANGQVFDDHDTYLGSLVTGGQGADFEAFKNRVSYSQLFYVAATSHRGMLYVLGASYYEPETFILRATALDTASQSGDLYTIIYENVGAGENTTNPLYYADARLPIALVPIADRAGTAFAGWYGSSGFDGDPVTIIPAGTTGDLQLWAKWVPKTDPDDPKSLVDTGDSPGITLGVILLLAASGLSLSCALVNRRMRRRQ